ncbi:YqaA family protein [Granulicella sp. S190]|uniref:YqaA family protein n=1 Tax=Granulicella sp. S190 TaxID=1747226 RepID=UPI00131BDA8F|nr:VTT domain-containing protein [Granulicella sp. S190]
MSLRTAAILIAKNLAAAVPKAAASHRARSPFLHLLFSFGLFGVFLVSIVDSSFIPLPLPGVTDIMIIILAAQHQSWFLLILLATAGSALGGWFSYQVGQSGGMAFIEKRIPARIFKRVCDWMENHAILSVALPAILPPPMPLSPFVLAAGALKMSRKKFLTTFILSRCLRHTIAAWLGIHYGRHIVHLWNNLSQKYATPVLIVLWTLILGSCAFAFWQLYKTSRAVSSQPGKLVGRPTPTT